MRGLRGLAAENLFVLWLRLDDLFEEALEPLVLS
jgi:hypothetical protein